MKIIFFTVVLATVLNLGSPLTVCILHAPRPGGTSYVESGISELQDQHTNVHIIHTERFPRHSSNTSSPIPVPVQQAGHDVVEGLKQCAQVSNLSDWIFMMEDDMVPCKGAMAQVEAALQAHAQAAAIFFSKFSRAFAISRQRLHAYTDTVLARIDSQPYDIVLRTGVWTDAPLVTHPVNLFHHIGRVSTVSERNDPLFLQQYGALRGDTCGEGLGV